MYLHHRIQCAPRTWKTVADQLIAESPPTLKAQGGMLYGIWRSQIGRPRDELTAITVWPEPFPLGVGDLLLRTIAQVTEYTHVAMSPTLRPTSPQPPQRQGNYAFRWFKTPLQHWPEFLELCAAAWPDFESTYDSQIIGLWRVTPNDDNSTVRSLLVTRRPDLAMWERSKLPANEAEAETRRTLSRRYDLCDDTVVYTSTLLTAVDHEDTARWT